MSAEREPGQLLAVGRIAVRGGPRLADLVYEQLARLIGRGEFPEGCKLPPEGELGERFGVSRPVIRDALARLKEQGVVRSQRGSGNVVVRGEAPGRQAYPPIRTIADLLHSYEFRISVEAATVRLASERRMPGDLGNLRSTLDRAADALDTGAFHLLADLNFEFHRAVARATHNDFYVRTIEMIPNFVGAEHLDIATFGDDDLRERASRIHAEHQAICEAIAGRDPVLAVSTMEQHISAARDHVIAQREIVPVRTRADHAMPTIRASARPRADGESQED